LVRRSTSECLAEHNRAGHGCAELANHAERAGDFNLAGFA
jgi:hypothetical protein